MPLPPIDESPLDVRNRIRAQAAAPNQTPCPQCDEVGGHADDCKYAIDSAPNQTPCPECDELGGHADDCTVMPAENKDA